jgi:subtilisin family serine protease
MRRSLPPILHVAALGAVLVTVFAAPAGAAANAAGSNRLVVVGYSSKSALRAALVGSGARLVRVVPQLKVAEVRTAPAALRALDGLRGLRYTQSPVARESLAEPGLAAAPVMGGAYEWQYAVSHEDSVPAGVQQAASAITIAVIDTGADVTAPDLAAKSPATWSVLGSSTDVTDVQGHGTFVSSLAAGSGTNGDGIAGFGGDAKLLAIQAGDSSGQFTDVDEAAALIYAVDHGAKIVNMSFGGSETSETERDAINYAVAHGVLLVAAAGNSGAGDNLPLYPAALLQPLGSDGQNGVGLAVGASTVTGVRASFSNFGSYISLVAPGENVFGAVSSTSSWSTVALPGSTTGFYGYSDGTSFASPEVAGAAALVWAANPNLTAQDVAGVLKSSASGGGTWNQDIGYGVLNAAAAVARAQALSLGAPPVTLSGTTAGTHVTLSWSSPRAVSYQLRVSEDGGPAQVLLGAATTTSWGYDLDRGHSYSFSVLGTDVFGLTGVSVPWTASVPSAPVHSAKLALRASATNGKKKLRVTLWAVLTPTNAGAGRAGRIVTLQSYTGGEWHRFAQTKTTGTGLAAWTMKLRRGKYLLRAVYGGDADLDAATSAGVRIRVR